MCGSRISAYRFTQSWQNCPAAQARNTGRSRAAAGRASEGGGLCTSEAARRRRSRWALDGPDDAEALVDPFSDEEQRSTVDVKLELESLGLRWMRLRRARRRLPPWLAL
jgi:hypothetical protein